MLESTITIPQNIESEEAAIGVFLADAATTLPIADSLGLRADDFYRPSLKLIYETIRHLHERGTVDELTVINELKARRKLKAAGGASDVLRLAERYPAVANAAAYIDDVIDQAKLRSMVFAGEEIARLGYEHPDKIKNLIQRCVSIVEVMANQAERVRGAVSDAASLSEWTVKHVLGETTTRDKWAYPLPELQAHTGGFGRGQLVSIGAQPGVGKSAFKNQILLALPNEVRVGIINLEMDREDEQIRLVSNLTGIDSRLIWDRARLSKEQQLAVMEAAENLGERHYEIHQGSKTIEQIRGIQRKHGYDVLLVDHTHRIDGVEDYQTLVRVSRMLKSIAVDEDCAVVSLFQLNKGENPGEIPNINRVKGGGAIHEDSDHMMFIHRSYNEFNYPTNNGQIIMAKQRGGTSGWAIKVRFNESRCAFEEA